MKFVKDYSRKSNHVNESRLINHVAFIKEDLLKHYESSYSSLLLPQDKQIIKDVSTLIKSKNKYSHLIVVGIGGSNLGTMAVLEAIKGKYHNFLNQKKVFFADTTDPDNLQNILSICKNKKFLLLIISKSGKTTESIANFEVLLKIIPKTEREERIIAITDKDSELHLLAKKNSYSFLEIPKKVGGRYSLLSPVGLFPLMFAGVNIKNLLHGANDAIENFNKNNVALNGALDLYHNYLNNKKINDVFLFSNDLESVGKWFRQLMGESIGKKLSINGDEIFAGITPTVSIGSTDLHSVGQLYLGGPRDKFTSFVSVEKQNNVLVPQNKDIILKNIQGLSFDKILSAILFGTMSAYKKNNLPFNHYILEKKSEYELGYFMQTKMLEIILLAHLINVNPFDQPSVEDYKKETHRLLK